jgi:rfaE bifunctional protein nucleotidyltransferase chain/domain
VVTPNEGEAVGLTGSRPAPAVAPGRAAGLAAGLAAAGDAARVLRHRWGARAVCVTRGSQGALLVSDHGPPLAVPAIASGGDACGAGDRFAVGVATELMAGALVTEAVARAVEQATRYVADGGALSIGDLWGSTSVHRGRRPSRRTTADRPTTDPPVDLRDRPGHDRPDVVRRVRSAGGTVVATGGCFDVLHAGHISLLEQARRLGDCLVVLLNSDSSVRGLKGPTRPRVGEADRARVLRALEPVDDVVVFDEPTPADALTRLRPHVFVKGGDYGGIEVPETEVLAGWGGHVVVVPYLAGRSSTRILQEASDA